MANDCIGTIQCPITGAAAEICRAKSGKFPYYYRSTASGIVHGKAAGFQQWILSNGRFSEPQQNPYAQSAPKPEPQPEPEPAPTPVKNWADGLFE